MAAAYDFSRKCSSGNAAADAAASQAHLSFLQTSEELTGCVELRRAEFKGERTGLFSWQGHIHHADMQGAQGSFPIGLEVRQSKDVDLWEFQVLTAQTTGQLMPKLEGAFRVSTGVSERVQSIDPIEADLHRLQRNDPPPPVAAPPAAPAIDAEAGSSWRAEGGRCGGYGSPENPQFLLRCPAGAERLVVTATRLDGARDQGMILFVYPYLGKGGYQTEIAAQPQAQSKYASTDSVEAILTDVAADEPLLLLPCLQSAGVTGPLSVSVVGCPGASLVELTEPDPTLAVSVESRWAGPTAAGYGELGNPQFLVKLPSGEHRLKFTVERSDGADDQGLIGMLYEYRGTGSSRMEPAALQWSSAGKGAMLKGQTEYVCSAKADGEVSVTGEPDCYVLLPCLQSAAVEGPFTVTVECDDGETRVEVLELAAQESSVDDQLSADLERIAAE